MLDQFSASMITCNDSCITTIRVQTWRGICKGQIVWYSPCAHLCTFGRLSGTPSLPERLCAGWLVASLGTYWSSGGIVCFHKHALNYDIHF